MISWFNSICSLVSILIFFKFIKLVPPKWWCIWQKLYVCVCVCVCARICMHTCACMVAHVCVCMHGCVCVCVWGGGTCTCEPVCVCVHAEYASWHIRKQTIANTYDLTALLLRPLTRKQQQKTALCLHIWTATWPCRSSEAGLKYIQPAHVIILITIPGYLHTSTSMLLTAHWL